MGVPARSETVVVALGGNTLLGETGPWTMAEQEATIRDTAGRIADVVAEGYEVVLTHGNGPQVGNLLLQQEAATDTPQLPLDVLVAETQAQLGYLLQRALDNELDGATDFVTLVTQVVVAADDPAFDDPTKPVGPYYSEAEAAAKDFETRAVREGDEPYRRVVPSPEPQAIVEIEEIRSLVAGDPLVICGGGGGVPVVREDVLDGVEAVVDKDLTSQVLANALDADTLVILTDVDHAYQDYGTTDERPIEAVDPATMRAYVDAGEFGTGSMQPKVEACCRFVEAGGETATITDPAHLTGALAGEAGTRVSE